MLHFIRRNYQEIVGRLQQEVNRAFTAAMGYIVPHLGQGPCCSFREVPSELFRQIASGLLRVLTSGLFRQIISGLFRQITF